MKNWIILLLGGAVFLAVVTAQQQSLRSLREEVAALREEAAGAATVTVGAPATGATTAPIRSGGHDLGPRVAALEQSVVQLNLAADFLMDRGQIPASQAKLEETRLKFLDVNLSDQDRLAALRFLNRGGAVNGEVAVAVAAWLSRGGTPDLTRSILESVRGVKDPALLPATLALAADKEERVRERALRNLGAFAGDPTVESTLWAVAASDASPHVRDRILGMLGDMPMDENRVAALVQRGADETATLQERTLSLRLLANAKADVTSVAAALARNAETVTDKAQFMVCLAAFDDVNNPAFLTAVVRGVQSSDQEVRLRATDTLRDYRGDPTAAQWLTYLAQNDPDPGVREEASRALRPESNRGGGGGNQGRAPGPR